MKRFLLMSLAFGLTALNLGGTAGCGSAEDGEGVTIVPPVMSEDILPTESDEVVVVPAETGDEVITPIAATAPEAEVPDQETPPAPETPPASPAGLTVSLAGSKALYETKEGLLKISYALQGGGDVRQFYIYGPFSDDQDCDGGLVIDPSGHNLNEGSPNYLKYQHLLSGELCKELEGNCRDFYALEAPGTFCRIELTGESGVFYTRIRQSTAKYVLVGETGDGTFQKAEVGFKMPPPKKEPAKPVAYQDTVAFAPWSAEPAVPVSWGNGVVDAGEECDDGNTASGDGCYRGKIDKGWSCSVPLFATASVCSRFGYECGDGHLDSKYAGETCDDGNGIANDGCYNCEIEAGWDCSDSMFTFTNTCWKI